jgi:hypothetical protein
MTHSLPNVGKEGILVNTIPPVLVLGPPLLDHYVMSLLNPAQVSDEIPIYSVHLLH